MAITYPTTLDVFTNPTSTSLLTSPNHAQQHSDINDAVEALEAKVAIGNTVLGTYTAHTPTFANLTVGNGTFIARVSRVNNVVNYYGYLTFGSTTSVTGIVNINLPVTANSTYGLLNGIPMGDMNIFDTSSGAWYKGDLFSIGSNAVARFRLWTTSGSNVVSNTNLGATAPMTWATGDQLFWNLRYEAA
jgi:hypothetical protein